MAAGTRSKASGATDAEGLGSLHIAVIFPGQGAQAPGLGQPWVDHPAWAVVERAEKATGEELAPLLLDAPAEALTRTREAQLVVFLASLLAWEAAQESV